MVSTVLLDNVTHADTVVAAHYSREFGDNITSTLTFPTEFVSVSRHYPILFRHDESQNKFQAVVLMGLQKDENLFLSEVPPFTNHLGSWLADYVPAMIAKGPFVIGLHREQGNDNPMVHIDMNHPKVGIESGKKLFLPQGGNSDYLNHISTVLMIIHNGLQQADGMYSMLNSMGLFEPISVDVELVNSEALQIVGHYTISEEKLANLNAEQLHQLNQAGYLKLAFMAASSLANIRKLVDLKNARILAI